MVASFDEAIKVVLKHEGGFVNDKNDDGGATNFGISLRFLKGRSKEELDSICVHLKNYPPTIECIKNLTKEDATKIYKHYWWERYKYGKILNQKVSTKIFDISVNAGPFKVHSLIQQAVNKVINNYPIMVDGIIGTRTINAINLVNPEKLLSEYINLICDFYRELCMKNEKKRGYLKGWLNRAND